MVLAGLLFNDRAYSHCRLQFQVLMLLKIGLNFDFFLDGSAEGYAFALQCIQQYGIFAL